MDTENDVVHAIDVDVVSTEDVFTTTIPVAAGLADVLNTTIPVAALLADVVNSNDDEEVIARGLFGRDVYTKLHGVSRCSNCNYVYKEGGKKNDRNRVGYNQEVKGFLCTTCRNKMINASNKKKPMKI